MGNYLNPGSTLFRYSLRSEIYVDKSGLIEKTNKLINTEPFGHFWFFIFSDTCEYCIRPAAG